MRPVRRRFRRLVSVALHLQGLQFRRPHLLLRVGNEARGTDHRCPTTDRSGGGAVQDAVEADGSNVHGRHDGADREEHGGVDGKTSRVRLL